MKPFIMLGLILGIFGCKAGCDVEKVVAEGLGTAVAKVAHCSNTAKVNADILRLIDQAKLCPPPQMQVWQGVIAHVVCPIVVKAGVGVIGSQVPPSWGCDLSASALPVVLLTACESLPF